MRPGVSKVCDIIDLPYLKGFQHDCFSLYLQDSKCLSHMNTYYSELFGPDWQRQAFTVCSGSDLVDITYHHFMCSDALKAEVNNFPIL